MSREDRLKQKRLKQARQQARKNKQLAIGLAMLEGYGNGAENARSRDRKAA